MQTKKREGRERRKLGRSPVGTGFLTGDRRHWKCQGALDVLDPAYRGRPSPLSNGGGDSVPSEQDEAPGGTSEGCGQSRRARTRSRSDQRPRRAHGRDDWAAEALARARTREGHRGRGLLCSATMGASRRNTDHRRHKCAAGLDDNEASNEVWHRDEGDGRQTRHAAFECASMRRRSDPQRARGRAVRCGQQRRLAVW